MKLLGIIRYYTLEGILYWYSVNMLEINSFQAHWSGCRWHALESKATVLSKYCWIFTRPFSKWSSTKWKLILQWRLSCFLVMCLSRSPVKSVFSNCLIDFLLMLNQSNSSGFKRKISWNLVRSFNHKKNV